MVPDHLAGRVALGTIVRVSLHGRRVRGWVVATDVEAVAGRRLAPLSRVTGLGPAPELLELAEWAAWRWAGRQVHFLRAASPRTAVLGLPEPRPRSAPAPTPGPSWVAELAAQGLARGHALLRLPPATDALGVIDAAVRLGPTLVVVPSLNQVTDIADRLRAGGHDVAVVPEGWARAATGAGVVVGSRAAAWAPMVDLAVAVVLDEHDEAHQSEAAPTWHGRDVLAERARRAGARCLWVSPCPSLEALASAPLLSPSRADERRGWPVVDVIDRRREEPLRAGLYSPRLVELLRRAAAGAEAGSGPRAVCVLNRKGRFAQLVCTGCGELARCGRCQVAVVAGNGLSVVCRHCGQERPALCLVCGRTRLKRLRPGVSRVREELEILLGVAVAEVSADVPGGGIKADAPVVVGTEAALHRRLRPAVVAFLDLDAEMLAPRHRAAEQAFALVVRAARMLGGRGDGGRLVVQTRLADHEVVQAALHADPARVATAESRRRTLLRLPPASAVAVVSGPSANDYVDGIRRNPSVEVLGPDDGRWLVRAEDHQALGDALASVPRPGGRLRVAVDPPRL